MRAVHYLSTGDLADKAYNADQEIDATHVNVIAARLDVEMDVLEHVAPVFIGIVAFYFLTQDAGFYSIFPGGYLHFTRPVLLRMSIWVLFVLCEFGVRGDDGRPQRAERAFDGAVSGAALRPLTVQTRRRRVPVRRRRDTWNAAYMQYAHQRRRVEIEDEVSLESDEIPEVD